jgi:hypothetical protein
MRRFFLRIVVMMLTFAAGTALHYIILNFTAQPELPAIDASPQLVARVNESSIRETPPPPPAVVEAPKELSDVVVDYDFDKFAPDGTYFLMGNPKGFREFSSFSFYLDEINKDGSKHSLQIETKGRDEYDYNYDPANFGLITDQRVFFVVSKVSESGVGYRFDGKFLYRNLEPFAGLKKPVLAGTLTKTKFGHTIAEHFVYFRIEFDGC